MKLILFLFCALSASAAEFYVIADTNQLHLLPASIKLERRTNLVEVQTITEVSTNWAIVGPPQDIKDTNGVVVARRVFQSSNYLTNVFYLTVFGAMEYRHEVSKTLGPLLENRHYDIPPQLPSGPTVAVPARIEPR